jgi:integrase
MGEIRRRGRIWFVRYRDRNGKRHEESSRSTKERDARRLLRLREGKIEEGVPVTPKIGRLRFDEAAADLLTDYRIHRKRSADTVERRIRLHLQPWFGGRRLALITPADIRSFIAKRQADRTTTRSAYELARPDGTVVKVPALERAIVAVSNAEINRELTILKRIYSLAIQSGKLLHKPHIPLLREDNTRTGFFEPEQLTSVLAHLPAPLHPVIEFAYITGWRIHSEVLPLEWHQVDFRGGEVRLAPGTTKNRAGRVFPMTDDLRALLEARQAESLRLKKAGQIVPWVFFRLIAQERGGPKQPVRITSFTKAWKRACLAAGCPGRIPHDLRRTAVRNMVRRSVPERVAMQLTGHKTRSIFERYNIVSDGDLRSAAAQLGGLLKNRGGSLGAVGGSFAPERKRKREIL